MNASFIVGALIIGIGTALFFEIVHRVTPLNQYKLPHPIKITGVASFALANYVPNMAGWSDPPGKFSLARERTMVNVPYFFSIILIIFGLILLLLKELKALLNKLLN